MNKIENLYEVRKSTNGDMCIMLKKFNIRIATFSKVSQADIDNIAELLQPTQKNDGDYDICIKCGHIWNHEDDRCPECGSQDVEDFQSYKQAVERRKELISQPEPEKLLEKMSKVLISLKMSMSAHPDYEKGSEFEDMVTLADDMLIEYKNHQDEE